MNKVTKIEIKETPFSISIEDDGCITMLRITCLESGCHLLIGEGEYSPLAQVLTLFAEKGVISE